MRLRHALPTRLRSPQCTSSSPPSPPSSAPIYARPVSRPALLGLVGENRVKNERTSSSFSMYLAYASSVVVPSTLFQASLGEVGGQCRRVSVRRNTSAPAADDIEMTHHLALPTKSSIPGRAVFTSPTVAAEDRERHDHDTSVDARRRGGEEWDG